MSQKKTAKETVLVAGGAGFIGSHLCEALLAQGKRVACVDNLCTGSKKNIQHLLKNKNFAFLKQDIIDGVKVKEKLSLVFNLASPASPLHYQRLQVETLLAGALGTKNLLDLALKNKAVFLQASTSEVYGDPLQHPQTEEYWGNVNPIGERSCFSEDTEILTLDGWKFFRELTKNDFILTLAPSGYIEYCAPVEIIKHQYVGQLIEFKNSKIDLLVTPNHKMYVKPRDRKFALIEAFESIRWERAEMQKSAKWIGKEEKFFNIPKVSNAKLRQITRVEMDIWLEFFGYFLSEGSTHLRKRYEKIKGKIYDSNAYYVLISQSKKNKHERQKIKDCLVKLGFKFYEENAQFRIASKQLFSYLRQFGKAREKFIPTEFKQLPPRQLQILLGALMLGDGNKKGTIFYSSSKKLIGGVQELLLKVGLAGTISDKDKRQKNPVFRVHFLDNKNKDFLTSQYPKRKIISYNGYVWCVNVPNHVIYVRRNGKALFCGNCYDESKRFAEALVMAYHRKHNLSTRIARIFNTFGPRMQESDGRAVPNFISQALSGKDISIYGDGSQTRSFCYVSDMVDGLLALAASDYFLPVNLGNPEEHSILEFAETIKSLADSRSEIVFRQLPKDDPLRRKPDISRAKKLLGWEPKVSLEEGLKKTIDYFRKQ